MSCSNIQDSSYLPRAYFTFRAGAYNPATGGLSLTTGFYNATQYDTPTARGQALAQSDYNSNTLLSLSLRSTENYQDTPLATNPSAPVAGTDFTSFLPSLDSAEIAGPLAALPLGMNLNYFPGPDDQRLMEASLSFFNSDADAAQVRTDLISQKVILVAGYTGTADVQDTSLRSPYDVSGYNNGATVPQTGVLSSQNNTNSIYGVGYQMIFSTAAGMSAGDARVISPGSGITEKDLVSGLTQSSTWSCSNNYQFQIVRPEDQQAGYVICSATADTVSSSPQLQAAQTAALTAIRRVLRVEDWYVDLDHHCVMPKAAGGDYCYGAGIDVTNPSATTQLPYIQYAAYNSSTGTFSGSCVDNNATLCPHFVSVCIRQ